MDAVKGTIQFAKDAGYVEYRAGDFQHMWHTNTCASSYQVCMCFIALAVVIIFNNHVQMSVCLKLAGASVPAWCLFRYVCNNEKDQKDKEGGSME